MSRIWTLIPLLSLLSTSVAWAEEPPAAPAAPPAAPVDSTPPIVAPEAAPELQPSPKKSKLNQKGKRFREKEAEGTEAADRFEADTVIKSRYELNGKPLEVDPD